MVVFSNNPLIITDVINEIKKFAVTQLRERLSCEKARMIGEQRKAFSKVMEAVERFVLTVGNVHGTRLLLDGHDVSLPLTRSNVVRDFVLTRDVVN